MDVAQQVHDYLVESFMLGDGKCLEGSQSLLESGIIDSTGAMELVMFLEQTFKIEVADEDLVPENLDTINSIVQFVKRKTVAQSGRPGN